MIEQKFSDVLIGARFYDKNSVLSMKIHELTDGDNSVNYVVMNDCSSHARIGETLYCEPDLTVNTLEKNDV